MPIRALQCCPTPGCCNLTTGGPCVVCKKGREVRRGSAHSRGYNDARYHAWREAVLLQSDGLCVCCLSTNLVTIARVADHIVPRSAGGAQYDVENGQGLCDGQTGRGCHDVKRSAERRGRQLTVVSGKGFVDVGPLRVTEAA